MPAVLKILAASLATTVLGAALVAAPGFADSGTITAPSPTAPAVTPPTDRQMSSAIDALRDVLESMVDRHAMTLSQRDAVVDAARRADWDGFSIERLGDILGALVRRDTISAKQRDAILDGVRHSRSEIFRLATVLDHLTPSILSRAQHDAIVDALHRSDWDGFSIERLGDILQGLVDKSLITSRQRDAVLDAMRR